MQSSNAPSKLPLPFASSGAKTTIPVASQIGITPGAASYTDGFPPLTRTPLSAGGVPPSGQDTNGILYALSSILRWSSAGAGFPYDSTFATDSNVGGYPAGARVMRSDGTGYWLNTIDNNTTDPENTSAGVAAAAGWVPDIVNGSADITMTSSNVTLTPAQYGKPIITITGTLTANLNLIFPAIYQEWSVVNNTTGNYSITAKTASGTGVILQSGVNLIYSNSVTVAFVGAPLTNPVFTDGLTLGGFTKSAWNSFAKVIECGFGAVDFDTNTNTLNFAANCYAATGKWVRKAAGHAAFFRIDGGNRTLQFFSTKTTGAAGDDLTSDFSSPVFYVDALGVHSTLDATTTDGLVRLGQFSASTAANGYQKLPNGLMVQWGVAIGSGGGASVSFPIIFPTAAFGVVATCQNTTSTADVAETANITAGNFTLYTVSSGSGTINGTCFYIAIGK